MLTPVREAFATSKLDFEQIMQRDINDARVSTELIPYLLEDGGSGLVKLFPPIIVVVLPTNDEGLPADYYPTVRSEPETDDSGEWMVVRSGSVGAEVFELRQFIDDGEVWDHDYATLKINTTRSSLVIVDGQHRAMALIALYRNIKGWPDAASGVEPYYKLWSKEFIDKYNLRDVKLPVMFCVFPGLDGQDTSQPKVHAACRAVFLALNKNARRVTKSRNCLLDDRDLMSSFLRRVLSEVKMNSDANSGSSLRLWNVELDADEDRVALTSPVAITGVSHLFGLIERLMLGSQPGSSLNGRRENLANRSRLDACVKRLQATDLIARSVLQDLRRNTCDQTTTDTLVDRFQSLYGHIIVSGLTRFYPYCANSLAALQIQSKLSTGATADFYRRILFEGQGMDRVFRDFINGLSRELRENTTLRSPELSATSTEFRERQVNLTAEVRDLERRRHSIWLDSVPARYHTVSVTDALLKAYDNTFVTAAFQSAIFLTFFAVIDEVNEVRGKPPNVVAPISKAEATAEFSAYIESLNGFFKPKSREGLVRLLSVFSGRVSEAADGSIDIEDWSGTLRAILIPGELKPDEWSKFRPILIELWKPQGQEFTGAVGELRLHLRKQALDRYTSRRLKEESGRLGVLESRLGTEVVEEVQQKCAMDLQFGLKQLGVKVAIDELRAYQRTPEEEDAEGEVQPDEPAVE